MTKILSLQQLASTDTIEPIASENSNVSNHCGSHTSYNC